MKSFKVLLAVLIIATFFVSFTPISASADWVNGYSKKDGTYVNGYWKSNPNGLKYDNYSFDGNWADAFNDSYYSPTKNYSADWYKPTWVTQDNYSLGKSFYDTRDTYSSYNKDLYNYDYSYWDDPIYKYTPSYNYGYNYLDKASTYTSSYFDYTTPSTYSAPSKPSSSSYTSSYSNPYSTSSSSYSTPSNSSSYYSSPSSAYSSPYSSSYTNPYSSTSSSYSSPSYSSYSTPSYSSYSSPPSTSYSSSSYSW